MGVFMAKPCTEKHSDDGGSYELENSTRFGVTAMQGWRVSMEDAHLSVPQLENFDKIGVYGVFDGHGGSVISEWVGKNFTSIFSECLEKYMKDASNGKLKPRRGGENLPSDIVAICEALHESYIQLDIRMSLPDSRVEQNSILNAKKLGANPEKQKTFLQELLNGNGDGQKRVLRVVEQNGSRFLQIINVANEEDEDAETDYDRVDTTYEGSSAKSQKVEEVEDLRSLNEMDAISSSTDSHSNDVSEESSDNKDGNQELDDSDDDDYYATSNECASPSHCGTTAVVAIFVSSNPPYLVVANAGDSRAVLSRSGQAISLTHDHKPDLANESDRILKAGGTVENGRVDGNLNMSRTLGDLQYKSDNTLSYDEQKITAVPDIRVIQLTSEDEFCILACDGIWDVLDNQLCTDVIRINMCDLLNEVKFNGVQNNNDAELDIKLSSALPVFDGIKLSRICEKICDSCLATSPMESEGIGCDNMTMMIVQLGTILRKIQSRPVVANQIGEKVLDRLKEVSSIVETGFSANRTINTNVNWISKSNFNIVHYGEGLDDGFFDKVKLGD